MGKRLGVGVVGGGFVGRFHIRSFAGVPEPVRGGRAKKHIVLTPRGRAALRESHTAVVRMAEGLSLK